MNLSGADAPAEEEPEKGALLREIERLHSRIAMLEAQRDEYAAHNAELFVLQQVFSTINSSLELDDILSTVLRGVCEALHFNRVILFEVGEDASIVRRLETGAQGAVVAACDPHDFVAASTLADVARGTSQIAFGSDSDTDKPLRDTRGYYCIAPLVARNVVRGMLYADDSRAEHISENQIRVLLDFAAQAAIAIENGRLYEQTRQLLEETQRLALTDSLTAIPNRRALDEMLERELHGSERYDTPLALAIFDLDDLKKINDSGGHSLGDLALKRFAAVLKRSARKSDIVARYAGDEFVIVMPKTGREAAVRATERILTAIRRAGLQASIGVAMFPNDGIDVQTLFFAADQALYRAKQGGKNAYRFHAFPSERAASACH